MPATSVPVVDPGVEGRASDHAGRDLDVTRIAVLGLLAAGTALRVFQYLANRSLWLDEALIATNVLNRSFSGLVEPLEGGQTAPTGFLLLVKLATVAFGTSEFALRLVPLAAGLVALLAFVPLARRYVSRNAVPLAVALFALAPYLIYYASEVKPYSVDALASVVILGLGIRAAEAPGIGGRDAAVLVLAGVLAVWVSQPAVFVLAGTGLVLFARAAGARRWRQAGVLAGVGSSWLTSFVASYALARRSMADPEYMEAFWRTGFLPLTPSSPEEWLWLPALLFRVFGEPLGAMGQDASRLGLPQAIAGAIAFVAGVAWMARARDVRLALLLAPVVLTLAASALHLYPFGGRWLTAGRVLIFLIPGFVLLMAEGTERLRLRLGRRPGLVAAALLGTLMLAPSATYAVVMVPQARSEMKPLLQYANEHRRPGDVMYVYYYGRPAFEYYGPRYGWDPEDTVIGTCSRLRPAEYLRDLDRLRGTRRIWVLFVDGFGARNFDERQLMVSYLDHVGLRLDDRVSHGVSLYLFSLLPEFETREPFRATIPEFPETLVAMDCRGPWAPPSPRS